MSNSVRLCLRLWWWNAIFHVRTKRQTCIKNSIWKIGGLSVVHPARKTVKQKFIYLFMAPPNRKQCGTALERWIKPNPPLWAFDVNMPPFIFTLRHKVPHLDYMIQIVMEAEKTSVYNFDYFSLIGRSDGQVIDFENFYRFQTLVLTH